MPAARCAGTRQILVGNAAAQRSPGGRKFEIAVGRLREIANNDAKIKLMHSLQEKYNYTLSLNGTYQLHNMLNLEQFYNWCLQYVDLEYIEMRVLSGPKWLQARHATDRIKFEAPSLYTPSPGEIRWVSHAQRRPAAENEEGHIGVIRILT